MKERALELLRIALGDAGAEFRRGQWESIRRLVEERNRLLVVQRTGWGKSMVYFLATKLLREQGAGPSLLISPLLSLMRNQIEAARRMGVRAHTINSTNRDEWDEVFASLEKNEIDILLIAPERLANEDFRNNRLMPLATDLGLIVVDEAHCISDWGHDFRVDYRRIVNVLRELPDGIPVLATTATANDRVVADIREQLGEDVQVVRGPLARTSLKLQNIRMHSQAQRMAWLAQTLPRLDGSGIIYTLTQRDAERVATWLRDQGIDTHAYHAGMEAEDKIDLEDRLLRNDVKALVATVALGMGFDKPDLAFVVHYQRPGSVVAYYQQVGRAGRAMDNAYGVLLSGKEDDDIIMYFMENAFPPEELSQEILGHLEEAEDGLSVPELQGCMNASKGRIEKALTQMAVLSPSPVRKEGWKWSRTPVRYVPDTERIEGLRAIREEELASMNRYMDNRGCLMHYLQQELSDPTAQACGRCAVCQGQPLLDEGVDDALVTEALRFLRHGYLEITPRKRWMCAALEGAYGWKGNIAADLQCETGRALCAWGDGGWGRLVKSGKQDDGVFSAKLVEASREMVEDNWSPDPAPSWVTCIPSLKHPDLVPAFAAALAESLELPFVPCIAKVKDNAPQKDMRNSPQQMLNLAGVFEVDEDKVLDGPVLLVDDMVDSKWTFTVAGALLRSKGSGPVLPLALADSSSNS